jgi:hypothetical protein
MQAAPPRRPPLGVAFDSSLDGGVDQVLALAMLFGFEGKRQIRIPSVTTSRFNLQNAAFLDLVARFFGGEQAGDFVVNRIPLPIGMSTAVRQSTDATPMVAAALARTGADGKPLYARGVARLNDTADPVALIRNALSAQVDANGVVVLAGLPANLTGLLALPDGREWVARKASVLAVAGGRFDTPAADPVIRADVAGFKKLLAEWPSRIVMAGLELNDALPFPGSSVDASFAWARHHPVADAYRAFNPMPYDAPTRALAATLYAVSPDENFFQLSEPGTITVLDDGRTRFTASPAGRHQYLIARPDQQERVLQTYVQMVSAQPPPRPARGGPRPAA